MMILLKSHIIKSLQEIFPYHSKDDLSDAITIILSSIEETLKKGGKVEIRGFGTFEVKNQIKKEFLNPKTQQLSKSAKGKKVYFKPSLKLKKLGDL